MRMTPSQGAFHQICGTPLPFLGHCDEPMHVRIKNGHDMLVIITGMDFGYDLQAWHDHLKESRQGGYTYGRNILLPKIAKKAMLSQEWTEAVRRTTGSTGATHSQGGQT